MKPKVLLVGIVVAVAVFFLTRNSLEPFDFDAETYSHMKTTEVNNVVNHFFTPGGAELATTTKYIQITDYGHPDLTDRQVQLVKQQISTTMSLKPLKAGSNRYFGMFRNQHPLYGVEKNRVFVIYAVLDGFEGDERALRSQANKVIDTMESIPTVF